MINISGNDVKGFISIPVFIALSVEVNSMLPATLNIVFSLQFISSWVIIRQQRGLIIHDYGDGSAKISTNIMPVS